MVQEIQAAKAKAAAAALLDAEKKRRSDGQLMSEQKEARESLERKRAIAERKQESAASLHNRW